MAKIATKPTSPSAKAEKPSHNGHATTGTAAKAERLPVMKTYKIFIGGKFPRTESGRYYQPKDADGKPLANVCRSSRKDVRESVVAARKAFGAWSGRSAFNRGQILYRIGEMLEGRSAQFVHELVLHGATRKQAEAEVTTAIDRWVHYAGWCDKYQAVFSSVNPTNSSHFNFSVQEPTGVVGVMCPGSSGLIGLVSVVAPIIAGGNTAVVVASEEHPLPAVTFAEVLATSDLPGGVVNLLTGFRSELLKPLVTHMDINAMVVADPTKEEKTMLGTEAAVNMKRLIVPRISDWSKEEGQSPYFILDTQEVKTTWHPIERGQGGGGGY
ncbi:MAG: aldehyde dehydrogenase family protein [Flavobacteriales bacterium]|jgi:acyl-CoA reductase-like NAD-dependent aldehyde dehydrogenase|nr:aldehyde dehydrogenase family protein [Flavobacteriales bacterium]MCB0758537.1 aldehyde dehydrogenase family protein [Flavobacteriales bacterium]